MTTYELQQEILRLKKEKNACILAHSYQGHDVLEIADICGDSFRLSQAAAQVDAPLFIVCGVHFMAETVKLLSPEKKVILAHPQAGCPMAEQFGPEEVLAFRKENPDAAVVCYVNTTAALKAVCDVCVTSSSAVNIVKKMTQKKILFIPDCHLGAYVASHVPDKEIVLWNGGCPIHAGATKEDVARVKAAHPNAKLLVHPECLPEVVEQADMVGSTADILKYARQSTAKEFIIGTEISIAEHLSFECPEKVFYPMWPKLQCADMRLTTLPDVHRALLGTGGLVMEMEAGQMAQARRCIDAMIRLG
ncbi:MAG: quinolinate synthase NadA [Clostridia bacterium]|nr:quinolinate synthase NadA [Clostridia bacterium]